MSAAFKSLEGNVDDIFRFMNFAASLEAQKAKLGAAEEGKSVVSYLSSPAWKKHVYSYVIVGIYGAHERFVTDFSAETAVFISQIYSSYNKLPDKIRQSHERLTLELAQLIFEGRSGQKSDLQQVIANLHSCLDGGIALNHKVFSSSSANFRSNTVREIFSRLAIEISQDEPSVLASLVSQELNGYYTSSSAVLDALADLRNEIAHGSDFTILDRGTLTSIVKVIHLYNHWLLVQVATKLKSLLVENMGECVGTIGHTYKNTIGIRSIGSVPKLLFKVSVGDTLYIKSTTGYFEKVKVKKIQFNKADVPFADDIGPFGIDFEILVRDGADIIRLPSKHASISTQLDIASQVMPLSSGI